MKRSDIAFEDKAAITKLVESFQFGQTDKRRSKVDMDVFIFFNMQRQDFLL